MIRPDHIGDMLFATNALRMLRTALPDVHLTAMVLRFDYWWGSAADVPGGHQAAWTLLREHDPHSAERTRDA